MVMWTTKCGSLNRRRIIGGDDILLIVEAIHAVAWWCDSSSRKMGSIMAVVVKTFWRAPNARAKGYEQRAVEL